METFKKRQKAWARKEKKEKKLLAGSRDARKKQVPQTRPDSVLWVPRSEPVISSQPYLIGIFLNLQLVHDTHLPKACGYAARGQRLTRLELALPHSVPALARNQFRSITVFSAEGTPLR